MSGLKPYPAYKNSRIDWLGEVPDGWGFKKFRYLFRESNEVNGPIPVGPMLSVSGYRGVEEKSYEFESQIRDNDQLENYRVVHPGQLAVNTMWMNYAGLGISELTGHISPAYRAYWVSPELNGRYAHHLLRSSLYVDGYTALLTGIRPNSLQLNRDNLMSFPVLLPPLPEQQAIATYLDRETTEIDAFVQTSEQLIALLNERRAAVITQAVTKGLDPTAPMKDSGIEWLGEVTIPSHWQSIKLSHIGRFKSGDAIDGERIREDGDFPVYGGGGFRGFTDTHNVSGDHPMIGRQGALCGKVWSASGSFYATEHAIVAYPKPKVSPYWLERVLSVMNLGQYSTSAAQPGISVETVTSKKVPVPPLTEQQAIADHLDRETARIDEAITEVCRAIELAKERRQALISAAVTGKIDVREAV